MTFSSIPGNREPILAWRTWLEPRPKMPLKKIGGLWGTVSTGDRVNLGGRSLIENSGAGRSCYQAGSWVDSVGK